jgi:hypothetical protein
MLTTQSEKIQKFEFEFLAGIWSNTWRAKSREIEATVSLTVPVRLVPVAMLVDVSAAEPSPLCPNLSREKWRRRRRRRPDPPLSVPLPLPLCKLPTAVTSPEPTHSTPSPRQNPANTRATPPCPASPVHVASTPCAGHSLGAPVPASLAYKNPRRSNEWTHTTPSYLPDNLSSLLSLSFDVASPAGEVLDAGSTAAWSRRWTNGRREVEEEGRRSLFRPSPSSSASSTRAAVAVVFLSARR